MINFCDTIKYIKIEKEKIWWEIKLNELIAKA
jgi:hypothetical protein